MSHLTTGDSTIGQSVTGIPSGFRPTPRNPNERYMEEKVSWYEIVSRMFIFNIDEMEYISCVEFRITGNESSITRVRMCVSMELNLDMVQQQ
jgi:hypothetical protein